MSDVTLAGIGNVVDFNALLNYYANDKNYVGQIQSLMQLNKTSEEASDAEGPAFGIRFNDNDTTKIFDALAIVTGEIDNVFTTMAISASISPNPSPSPSPSAVLPTTEMPIWLIPSYSIILLCAIVGNSLVISTLVQNRRMRTITNLFLLNLAISDMLLGVLCMPVTLVGTLLRNFIFGEFLCKLIQFSQAASVAVSSWTLVAISCERYYAICHPLRSRSWQTMSHAYRIIGFIWIGGMIWMMPIAIFSQLIPTSRQGYRKCREDWPRSALGYERFYNMLLDLILFVLPLMVLCLAYILITRTLYVGMHDATERTSRGSAKLIKSVKRFVRNDGINNDGNEISEALAQCQNGQRAVGEYSDTTPVGQRQMKSNEQVENDTFAATDAETKSRNTNANTNTNYNNNSQADDDQTEAVVKLACRVNISPSSIHKDATLRRSNEAKTLESKKRVVKMLFVLVLEFFICWTPLYVINTVAMFIGPAIYEYIDYTSISFLQLLAYSSSCCNPITYCFMNASFRRAFVDSFKGLPMQRARNNSNIDLRTTISSSAWHRRSKHEMGSGYVGGKSADSSRL